MKDWWWWGRGDGDGIVGVLYGGTVAQQSKAPGTTVVYRSEL